jgi:predicted transcriptional regulator
VKTVNDTALLMGAEKKTGLTETAKDWKETCDKCHPLTPVACVAGCRIWKQKNEFRGLCEKMKNKSFATDLQNTLKNKRRLQILEAISKGQLSLLKLQQELKKLGYHQSQQTISEEYLAPLIEVGLAEENQNIYSSTAFGSQLSKLMKDFDGSEDVLPRHSECYEETALSTLLDEPKTFTDFEGVVPARSVARVLTRLQKAKLVETAEENDYVFYFRTKRDQNKADFSPTEKAVYDNIPVDGMSAHKLAMKSSISLRRTYKYLRKLKGKKMIFAKKRPKTYALTARGIQTAKKLKEIGSLVAETLALASQMINEEKAWNAITMSNTYPKSEKTA